MKSLINLNYQTIKLKIISLGAKADSHFDLIAVILGFQKYKQLTKDTYYHHP